MQHEIIGIDAQGKRQTLTIEAPTRKDAQQAASAAGFTVVEEPWSKDGNRSLRVAGWVLLGVLSLLMLIFGTDRTRGAALIGVVVGAIGGLSGMFFSRGDSSD